MKLSKTDLIFILLLPIAAVLMALEFGGNWRTFYEWLGGSVGFSLRVPIGSEFFMILAWVYLISFICTVVFEVLHRFDYMKLFSFINVGSIGLCFLRGIIEGEPDAICIGMILLLAVSVGMLLMALRITKKQ